VNTREATTAPTATLRTAGCAAVLLLGALCVPAMASNGLSSLCVDTDRSIDDTATVAARPVLAAHTETTLQDIIDDESTDTVLLPPARAEVVTDTVEETDEVDTTMETKATARSRDWPNIATRLPGIDDATLPSFRRHMYRTDI